MPDRLAACLLAVLSLGACGPLGESPTPPGAESPDPGAERPGAEPAGSVGAARNVLLLTLDTLRADALGAYGQQRPSSPSLDRLAREGVVFEQAVSASPLTLPSHATILTGLFPSAHGIRGNAGYALAPELRTLSEVLQEHGYRTGAEIAAPPLGAQRGLAQGFDHYRDLHSRDVRRTLLPPSLGAAGGPAAAAAAPAALDERPADDITRFGKRFLSENRARPFSLWLHYFDPHQVYVRRPAFEARIPEDPYLAEVLFMDSQIGELIRHLEALSLRERTLVVAVADHGEGRGDHGEAAHGYFLYDTTQRVPLLMWGPESLPRGRRIASVVRTADIAPTILELLELPPLAGIDGASLVPLLRGARALPLPAYAESNEAAFVFGVSPLRSLRLGDWKYIHHVEPELYQLAADPGETTNLAGREPERVAQLRAGLGELLAAAAAPPAAAASELDPEEIQRLRALGYTGAGLAGTVPLASLEVHGPAPSSLADDITRLSEAGGLAAAGQHERAEVVLREFAARHPRSPLIQRDHARALRALGRSREARAALQRAIEASPCDTAAREEMAQLLAEQGDVDGELAVIRTGVEHCPESERLLNHYAFTLATTARDDLRDGEEALRASRRALELAGSDRPQLLDTLAAAYAETGEFARAVEIAEQAVALAER